MSQEDIAVLVELFRKLKQWRDEKQKTEAEASLRSGLTVVVQEQKRAP